jgi:lipoate-protein ligase A
MFDDFVDPADHLALDEVTLMRASQNESDGSQVPADVLRVWEFAGPVVVAGRSTRIDYEIDKEYCRDHKIPVLRRCSGGASVVAGPGCLMYSVVLSHQGRESMKKIDVAHTYVMDRVLKATQQQVEQAELQGVCDLTWKNRKCSGNSLRVTRSHVLYHGTLLYDFDLELLANCLCEAPRQPTYRSGRDHREFVTNIPIDPLQFVDDLEQAFEVEGKMEANSLRDEIRRMREQRYDSQAWHFRH